MKQSFPGGKADKIPMGHFEDPPRGGFDFERLVLRDQRLRSKTRPFDPDLLRSTMGIHVVTVKTEQSDGSQSHGYMFEQ